MPDECGLYLGDEFVEKEVGDVDERLALAAVELSKEDRGELPPLAFTERDPNMEGEDDRELRGDGKALHKTSETLPEMTSLSSNDLPRVTDEFWEPAFYQI